jgi:hypothetical protein
MADRWTASASGTVARFRLADEPGQPVVATRGSYALRLATAIGPSGAVSAHSEPVAVSPNTAYTTTANLRFQWTGDSLTEANPLRPQVYLTLRYLSADGSPSSSRASDTFRWYQEDGAAGFGTFPAAYTTPADAKWVILEYGALSNGLAQPISFELDNVR